MQGFFFHSNPCTDDDKKYTECSIHGGEGDIVLVLFLPHLKSALSFGLTEIGSTFLSHHQSKAADLKKRTKEELDRKRFHVMQNSLHY